ncbi:MAG: hypothetical protein GH155_03905, partial [Spirochaeta sp.]|nr:hypothetical protein [Spirochaeta sp.]
MVREDDFQERRTNLKKLNERELKSRFWLLAERIVAPLAEEAKSHTSPSIERSVLLRMGFSGQEAKVLVNLALEKGLLGHGAGTLLLNAAHRNKLGIRETGLAMIQGNYWKYTSMDQDTVIKTGKLKSNSSGGNTAGAPEECYGKLDPDKKIDIKAILKDLEHYRPRRSGWTWR